MQIFQVGGAVRDEWLGLPSKDRDYVVVGATVDEMLANGFTPVGKDFPVFLHPKTQEEYALARTERKSGQGYKGFSFFAAPEVTLAEDLARRDLTINAIAKSADGELIDPFNGLADLKNRVLRHVGPAFVEDPVRLLRVARFSARFSDFSIAPETLALLRQMVEKGEIDHLVPERIWQEIATGLMENKPSTMIQTLQQCGALARLIPELTGLLNAANVNQERNPSRVMRALDYSAQTQSSLEVRFSVLMQGIEAAEQPTSRGDKAQEMMPLEKLCKRLKVPSACRDLAVLVAKHEETVQTAPLCAETIVTLLDNTDALRRPERFDAFLTACNHRARNDGKESPAESKPFLRALALIRAMDAASIARRYADKSKIPEALYQEKIKLIKKTLF